MKRSILLVSMLLLCLATLGWGREDKMQAGAITPAATGVVNTGPDRNGNVDLEVKVERLAAPDKLTPAYSDYVVWIQARGKDPENQGVLKVNEELKGNLKAITMYKDFDVFITAENNARAEAPSGPEVLRSHVSRD
jgi:hypothetical protein